MICDLDIKFVNKEITPSGGLSLFFQMLEKCHFEEWLKRCGIPFQGLNRDYQPLQLIMGLFACVNFRKKEFLKTIRYEWISILAYLGKNKDKHILYLARSLKLRKSFLSLWEKIKDFSLPYNAQNL